MGEAFSSFNCFRNNGFFKNIIRLVKYGQLSVAEFEKFYFEYPSTAIESDNMSADYGSLHKIEIILPRQRKGEEEENHKQGNVFITGNIFIKEGKEGNLNLFGVPGSVVMSDINVKIREFGLLEVDH